MEDWYKSSRYNKFIFIFETKLSSSSLLFTLSPQSPDRHRPTLPPLARRSASAACPSGCLLARPLRKEKKRGRKKLIFLLKFIFFAFLTFFTAEHQGEEIIGRKSQRVLLSPTVPQAKKCWLGFVSLCAKDNYIL